MKLLVCISNVPDTTAKVTFTNDNTQINTAGVQYILNPYDEIALSKALELSENGKGSVTVIHVGEASTEPTIRKALAIGADEAIRVDSYPKDALFTAFQIAEYAKNEGFDIVLTGQESIDYNGAEVPAMLGEFLNVPSISMIKKLELEGNKATIQRQFEGGIETIEVETPFVVSCTEGLTEPKIPNMRGIMSARTKPLKVINAQNIESVTEVVQYQAPSPRGSVKMLSPEEIEKLVELLRTEAKVL